ncbi:hypothetical protein [Acinetobacter entericus]|uniref:Uncharacterized protein n=1 Tax=Acinetobacter entericus TaxID=2989714 RepID=A0ABT3NEH7_9GAMM|nr:hypothetical protein [Acinetobacter entericus]MCW8037957.1 hypothetical protein [Acinetobacter entericus]
MEIKSRIEHYGLLFIGIVALAGLSFKCFSYFSENKSRTNAVNSTNSVASDYDIQLKQEGVLDSNFKYINSPRTYSFYKQVSSELNKSTPIDIGDGVQMVQALKIPNNSTYIYKLPIKKENFNTQVEANMNSGIPALKSTFCYQVKKHIHFQVNNMSERYVYLDVDDHLIKEIELKANQC